jgi:outer membrane protein insertion porin family/translocation and assembly module TamA
VPTGRNVFSLRLRAGAVAGRRFTDTLGFIPPQERLYAGGATSLRGYQQNELGNAVYIARAGDVTKDTMSTPARYYVADSAGFERVVPLGGNTLVVANVEYRVRDAFLFPGVFEYVFFVDAGDVWNRPNRPTFKWTPGVALSARTPVGPVQLNLGYNTSRSIRPQGAIYYQDPDLQANVSPLYCVSPGNTIDLQNVGGVWTPPAGSGCDGVYRPPQPTKWYRRFVLTFSIGSVF